MIFTGAVFADEKNAEEQEGHGIEVIYTDDGYVIYFDSQAGVFYFPSPGDFEFENSKTVNTVFSERKLFMPYNTYEL